MRILAGGSVFAGLRIEGVAGQGGMGVVYRATEPGLDRTVALKVIAPDLLEDGAARRRFVWEARAAAAIEHPNVVPIYAAGEEDGAAYIVMRMIAGGDLRGLVRREGGLAPARAAALVAQLGAALDAAHAAGIVHRDIKPANVLLDADEHVYLTDFGLARHLVSQSAVTRTGQWVGTLDYIAPEQIRGERVDARSDVYSLGCLLFYALSGRVPYRRESDEARLWAHLHAAPPRPSEHAPGLGRSFDAVVARAMAKRRQDRFASAGELGRAALAAVEAGGADAGRQGLARRRLAAAAGAVALVAAAAGGVLIVRGHDDPRRDAPRAAPSAAAHDVAREPPAWRVTASVGVAARPVAIEVAGGNAWVASTRRPRLGRIDAGTARRLRGPIVGRGPSDLAARAGVLWVAVADSRRVLRLDARTGRALGRPLRLPGRPRIVDSGAGAIWVAEQTAELGGPYALARIDPRTARVTARVTIPEGINDVRAGHGAVWVLGRQEATLVKLAPRDLRVLSRRSVGPKSLQLDLSERHLWVTSYDDDSVARIDRVTGKTVTIGVPSKPYGIAVGRDSVWVACFGAHSLVRIDRATSRVTGPELPVGLNPVGLDVSGPSLWVTTRGDDHVARVGN